MPARAAQKTSTVAELEILQLSRGEAVFCVLGTTPLIFNRMSEKAKRALLLPSGKMNDAEKATNLKHDPPKEYRDSVYRNPGEAPPTRLKFPASAFKGAMKTAALDLPGTRKTEIGRLVAMPTLNVDIYGIPRLKMDTVRSADISRTPDIRTRAALYEWACVVPVRFIDGKLRTRSVANLFQSAGMLCGIGDWRQEKGSGNHGSFEVVNENNADFKRIIKTGGRAAQDEALENYECYDEETEATLDWYTTEILRRGERAKTPKEFA